MAVLFMHCEDTFDLETDFNDPELVVDAWINNQPESQTIKLTLSQDYYDNRLPTPIEDARVVVCQTAIGSECFLFLHEGEGNYVWTPDAGDSLGVVGEEFALAIETSDGQQYGGLSKIRRVAPIDSISFQFEEETLGTDAGLYAQLYATDYPGIGDTYFVRTTINDTLLLRPSEFNLVYDATFNPGSTADGITFIFPIRFAINQIDDERAPQALQTGDKVEVEIWSITPEAFYFLSIARDQLNNGDSGIFGLPVANSPSNIYNIQDQSPALGIFNVAAVSSASRTVRE